MAEKILMKGNEALAEGAVRAGCRFFAGYPITPQNEVPEYMSWRMSQVGGAFVQSESEVSAINMIYGAAATGVRCMTSSSSPGMSLKQEGMSYCAGADLPLLVANVMRGGPGLGNIAGAQGDYWQATRGGGHGDYRTFVMAPNGVNEMANFPHKCYEVAYKYRLPSMILADGIIGQMMEPVEFTAPETDPKKLPEPSWALGINTGREKRIVKSYDLREGCLEKMVLERIKRYRQIEQNEVIYEEKMMEDAEIAIVAYGTSARVSVAGMKLARENGLKAGLLRPITLWPFPRARIAELSKRVKKFLVVEMSMGQMVEDVQLSLNGRAEVHLLAKPGAGVPTADELYKTLENIVKKGAKEYAAAK
ncbi:MAG: 3-methyl-2-oxobutanoate dehydrogenase subunit VorB [Elusimicrobia bacterium GWA2_56_46]|nr:MAG: 3-methyl-2-oxobutanoate dehydrogenase subunit VorB [Elusimicrobia bacterium GWA2_56_46]OGR54091.1 MAG: 3-methyl-2-oxobutanoate dehydrogenase subunit VorB [Elusimicrobia bacterium GWC2_56_31]HBW22965.1 3-methyl-2-oxobutanoate dehydrogenase subunit beta [Elusimicrobiota bacterium]